MTFNHALKKYLRFMTRYKGLYFSALLVMLLEVVFMKASPYIYGKVIDELSMERFDEITILIGVFIGLMVAKGAAELLKNFLIDRVIVPVAQDAKMEYIQALQYVDYNYHTNKSSGSLISLAKRGESALFTAMIDINLDAFRAVLEFVVTFAFVYSISPDLAAVMFIITATSFVIGYQFMQLNIKYRTKFNSEDDNLTGLIVDNMIGYETVKIFAQEKWEQQRFINEYKEWKKRLLHYFNSFKPIDATQTIIPSIGWAIVFWYGIKQLEADVISIGLFIAVLAYMFDLSRTSGHLVYKLRDLAKSYTDLKDYFTIMELKPTITDHEGSIEVAKVEGNVEFRDVAFAYTTDQNVLEQININIKPNEKIALVGKSGGGKTTFTKLLMRFYDVTAGQIMIDGHNIKDIKLESLRKAIGLVPQDPIMFNDTIEYNIAYGRPSATKQEVRDAAKKASLDDFIEKLPDKYKTIVGERGVKLSGGQKQRLAIARVILENPEIVIFDEATSQLDSANEKKIHSAFKNLTKNKTTIVIAHRLSTILDADRILVFKDGKIVQEGNHQALSKQKGIYQELWQLQTEAHTETPMLS